MPMAVMDIGKVRMPMSQPRMSVLVSVRLTAAAVKIVLVPMVLIVSVRM
jgi:hypothetical protein